ncbi:unnamed protein product, partial [Mesorhabditis belari]|uniref:RGS domain-containing protein n=1 Tax=Mesorhabditis belari TaxID=2138241 RepID=A0AAF3F026_9BILA
MFTIFLLPTTEDGAVAFFSIKRCSPNDVAVQRGARDDPFEKPTHLEMQSPIVSQRPRRSVSISGASRWMWRTFIKTSTPPSDEPQSIPSTLQEQEENNNKSKGAFVEDLEEPVVEEEEKEEITYQQSNQKRADSLRVTPPHLPTPPPKTATKPVEKESFPAIPDFLAASQDPRSLRPLQQSNYKTSTTPNKPAHPTSAHKMAVFDQSAVHTREAPVLPSIDGIEYPRAASWASGTLTNLLNDDKGRQLFRCFLFDALAEENLNFLEAVDKLKKMRQNDEKQNFAKEIVDCYSPYVNLSSGSMQKIKATAETDNPDPNEFAPACKEIRRLLENDQFPRFRRSDCYLKYLEELLPRSYAEKWATSFEALLGNHVGRQYFRVFLRSIHAEENLRFWEAVVEFRATKNKSPAMLNLAKVILQSYLAEGQSNEVFLPFGVRQVIERKIADKEVDITLFDEAIKHIEQVLRNDPYVRFLQCQEYLNLLSRLH